MSGMMFNLKNVFGYEKNSCMIWLKHNAGISEDKLEKKASLTAVFYLKNVPVDFRNPFTFRLLSAKRHQSGCGVPVSQ
ncbi:hypothetical protein LHV56_12620 [Peribacillus frigoritolerans]|uniref:hypothetical protein n=1 Tax=Peribacillus frigoritolerans TaxID=450367 RepID=UPI0020799B33|nr:hypothetical protein [Peribacillus frigoritolerans]USK82657.1 hypothetical protein LHV56_12620 [Peribacillus frigoritolerans]